MTVFVLEFQDYDNFYVIGVFTTLEKAMQSRDEFLQKNQEYELENTEITEHNLV